MLMLSPSRLIAMRLCVRSDTCFDALLMLSLWCVFLDALLMAVSLCNRGHACCHVAGLVLSRLAMRLCRVRHALHQC
jgi:hypothetical protein